MKKYVVEKWGDISDPFVMSAYAPLCPICSRICGYIPVISPQGFVKGPFGHMKMSRKTTKKLKKMPTMSRKTVIYSSFLHIFLYSLLLIFGGGV